jgi:preprotein translocase subunit SecB
MKERIMAKTSPEIYNRIMEGLELRKLHVESFSGHIDLETVRKAPKAIAVSISSDADFRSKPKNEVEITQKWDVVAKCKDSASECLNISVTYCLVMHSKERFTKSFFQVFEGTSLAFNMWPFVREFVNSMTARMGVPPLTIPLYKTTP